MGVITNRKLVLEIGLPVGADLSEDSSRSVLTAIVDKDQFFANRDGADVFDKIADRPLLVVDRNHDREQQVIGDRIEAKLPAPRVSQCPSLPLIPLARIRAKVGLRQFDGG